MNLNGITYSHAELTRAVRIERLALEKELREHTRRIKEIENRLEVLAGTEGLLEGEW